MIQRRKGILLLVLLIITGLAGRMQSDFLSARERRFLLSQLKDSKAALLQSIEDLSPAQLAFRPAPHQPSIRACVAQITFTQEQLWRLTEATLRCPPNPQKRSAIRLTDTELIQAFSRRPSDEPALQASAPPRLRSHEETVSAFEDRHAGLIRFARTTTDDMRNHIAELPSGALDSYQLLLVIAAHTARLTAQIHEIKADPKFPK